MKKLIILLLAFPAMTAWAGETDVVKAELKQTAAATYEFEITLQHADAGWKHYANKWDIVGPDEVILGTRILYHPHVDEQPFTRSLSGVRIPDGVNTVRIRGHDLIHGYGGQEVTVQVPR